MEQIKVIFERLYNEPFPSERGKEILGVDLVMIDADTMGIADCFISTKGHLTKEKINILESCYNELKIIIPCLEKNERQYFASLKQLANEILKITKEEKLTDKEIELRYRWKRVYKEIRNILNAFDPLGVADLVEDEYDDLNFKIYSTILKNGDKKTMFETIKSVIELDYGLQVNDNDIEEVVQKIELIKLQFKKI